MPERKSFRDQDEKVIDRARKDWETFAVKEEDGSIKEVKEDLIYNWDDQLKKDSIEIGELYEKNEQER